MDPQAWSYRPDDPSLIDSLVAIVEVELNTLYSNPKSSDLSEAHKFALAEFVPNLVHFIFYGFPYATHLLPKLENSYIFRDINKFDRSVAPIFKLFTRFSTFAATQMDLSAPGVLEALVLLFDPLHKLYVTHKLALVGSSNLTRFNHRNTKLTPASQPERFKAKWHLLLSIFWVHSWNNLGPVSHTMLVSP